MGRPLRVRAVAERGGPARKSSFHLIHDCKIVLKKKKRVAFIGKPLHRSIASRQHFSQKRGALLRLGAQRKMRRDLSEAGGRMPGRPSFPAVEGDAPGGRSEPRGQLR